MTIFDLTYSSDSNFIVQLKNAETGDLEGNLVNEIGAFDGEVLVGASWDNSTSSKVKNQPLAVKTTPGEYVLDITAEGSWSIEFNRADPTVGMLEIPQWFKSSGYQVLQPIELPTGLITFSLKHDGSSNFIVTLYAANGGYEELVANEIGSYEGETTVQVSNSGVYYLEVSADGTWEIDITS